MDRLFDIEKLKDMTTKNTIVFKVGDENRIVVEDLKGKALDESIFANQYRKALHVMDSYLAHQIVYNKELNDCRSNVFAFIGERGSGKTSCMTSVGKYLKSNDVDVAYPNLKKKNFVTLQLVDPTFFNDDKESIVGHIVSQLLREFKRICKEKRNSNNTDAPLEQQIVEQFQVVGLNIDCLNKESRMPPEDLEYLNQLSSAVDLKNNIRLLTEKLLQYRGAKDSIFVIPVDDIDMNRNGVTRIVEDIRKYLSNEYMLIMVAVHLNQLTLIEKQEYLSQYKTLLEHKQKESIRIDEMTEKFLDKFLPQAHRILMPEGNYYLDAALVIEDNGVMQPPYVSARQGVCEMIFAKTRYLFYNSNDNASRIIPRNLRDLRHLIGLLYNMADYNEEGTNEGDASGLYNKALFKEYLFGTWCREHLEEKMRRDVISLLGIADITLFNSRVIDILRENFDELHPLSEGTGPVPTEILSGVLATSNKNFNYSAGDALNLIYLLEGTTYNDELLNLLFILKSLYSIKTYEFYDERTLNKGEKGDVQELLLDDRVAKYGLSNYEKLVAGGFVNPSFYYLIPKEDSKISRQTRGINLKKLNELIARCVEHWDETPAESIQLAEFFILTTSRPLDTRHKGGKADFVEPDYRKRQEPYYAQAFATTMTSACFDANAFLFNMIRMEKCFERFPRGKELFEKIDAERNLEQLKSMWARLKVETLKREGTAVELEKFSYRRWLSWASIRNAEILQQLLNVLSFVRSENRNTSNNREVLMNFYREIAKYAICNYDKKDDGKFFEIDYKFTSIIADVLLHCDQGLFDSIYSSLPAAVIPYAELFDPNKRDNYSKSYVKKKICKFIRNAELGIAEDEVVRLLEAEQEEKITTRRVADIVNTLNAQLVNNGGAQENA